MVRVRRILKDYEDAGSVNALLAPWGFVDDHTFLTKAGALGITYRLSGVDDECLDHAERHAITDRAEQALRHLDESFRVYQYLIKRPASPIPARHHWHPVVNRALADRAAYLESKAQTLFEFDLYLVLLYEGWQYRSTPLGRLVALATTPGTAARELFSVRAINTAMHEQLTHALAHLHHKARAFTTQLDVVAPALLPKAEVFRFLRQLLNYAPHKGTSALLTHDTHLDYFISDSAIDCHRGHLDIDGYMVKALTMKTPPARTFAHMLHDLLKVPSAFIGCLEWHRRPNGVMRRELSARRRHFFNKRVSMINYLSPQTRPEDMLVDDSAGATVTELGQSLTEMEVHGRYFGQCSLTLVVYDRDNRRLDQSVAECIKTFAGHDGALYEESYNLLNSWLAIVPGNAAYNLRRLPILNTNAADLSFLFTRFSGHPSTVSPEDQESLAVFETADQTPYYWHLHEGDVGHSLVLGATGSGKSFLLNFLVLHAQKYDPITVIFDLGGDYEALTRRLGGSVWQMGLANRSFTINPFCLDPTPENRHFLASFVKVLLESGGQYQVSMQDDREIHEAVANIYALEPAHRRLFTLANLLPRQPAQPLRRWVQGGPYAVLFDHAEDTLTFQRIQSFNFEGLDKYPLLLEPLLFYVLHRASTAIADDALTSRLKLFVMDEAWRFVRDATLKAYITEGLKTWRKRNAAMLLATQSSEDFVAVDLLRTVVESCPTKFFLANPGIDLDRARTLFHLNHTEVERIRTLAPRREMLLKRTRFSKVLTLLAPQLPPDFEERCQ